jgi:hypothetical protein
VLDGPGIGSRWEGEKTSTLVQTDPGAQIVFYKMGTGSFPWLMRPGRGVTIHPQLSPRLNKMLGYTSIQPWGPPSLLYNAYLVFPEGKAAGAWC